MSDEHRLMDRNQWPEGKKIRFWQLIENTRRASYLQRILDEKMGDYQDITEEQISLRADLKRATDFIEELIDANS